MCAQLLVLPGIHIITHKSSETIAKIETIAKNESMCVEIERIAMCAQLLVLPDIHIITHKPSETIAKNDSISQNESIVSKSNEKIVERPLNRRFAVD